MSANRIGSVAAVTAHTTSASPTASATVEHATTATPVLRSAQLRCRPRVFSGSLPHRRTVVRRGRTQRMASKCAEAWQPVPRIARVRTDPAASFPPRHRRTVRVATAEAAAVRILVTSCASAARSSSPFPPAWKSRTSPWWELNFPPAFRGKTLMHLTPANGGAKAAMVPRKPSFWQVEETIVSKGSRNTERGGMASLPNFSK
mmetsp:Transcript_26264/g.60400  ORF Transcript_26264/g.60400 Transcript_26264/m.60400 type:complete len:203 (-) Transcript_26264:702-1310(-)